MRVSTWLRRIVALSGSTNGSSSVGLCTRPASSAAWVSVSAGGVHAEERAGRGLHPVGVLPEVDDVEVAGEQLVLAVGLLQRQGQPGLAQLATQRLLGGGDPLLLGRRRLQQGLLDQLLGERGAALLHAAGRQVGQDRAQRALHVEAGVLVEARVLDGDHRLLHDRGDLVARDRVPVLLVEGGDHLAVRGEHRRVARRRVVGQLERRVAEQAGRLLRDQGGAAHPGQQQPGEEGTGEDNAEGQHDTACGRCARADSWALPSDAGITSTENAAAHNPPRRP